MGNENDKDELGPDDGTVEMDRDAMMRRYEQKSSEMIDATTERVALGNEDSVETQSIAVPAELLQATRNNSEPPSTWAPKTIDIALEPVEEDEAHTIRESTQTTQPLGPVSFLELVAMIDENGCIQLPATLLKTPGYHPGDAVKIRIEAIDE